MSPINRYEELGRLKMTTYDFEAAGDELTSHAHAEGECHITVCTRGKVKAFGPWGEVELKSGMRTAWVPGQEHGVIAIEPNSRILNIVY